MKEVGEKLTILVNYGGRSATVDGTIAQIGTGYSHEPETGEESEVGEYYADVPGLDSHYLQARPDEDGESYPAIARLDRRYLEITGVYAVFAPWLESIGLIG